MIGVELYNLILHVYGKKGLPTAMEVARMLRSLQELAEI